MESSLSRVLHGKRLSIVHVREGAEMVRHGATAQCRQGGSLCIVHA